MDAFEDMTDEQMKQVVGDMMVRAAGIPKRFESGFGGLEPVTPEHIALIARGRAWAECFSRRVVTGLYLSGQTGCGKSHLAAAILRAVCLRGFGGRWVNLCELALDIRNAYNSDGWGPTEDEILADFEDVALVVFDDLGVERPTAAFLERLYLILKRRQDAMKPVVITSNYDGKALRERLHGVHNETADSGERIVAQLKGMVESLGTFPKVDLRRVARKPVEAQKGPLQPVSRLGGAGNNG